MTHHPSQSEDATLKPDARAIALELAAVFRAFRSSSHQFHNGKPLHTLAAEVLEALAAQPVEPSTPAGKDAEDAARYRWWRHHACWEPGLTAKTLARAIYEDDIDAAIDAARSSLQQQQEGEQG